MSWKDQFSNGPGRKSCCSASVKLLFKHSRGCTASRDSTQRNVGPNLPPEERAHERGLGDSAAFLRVAGSCGSWPLEVTAPPRWVWTWRPHLSGLLPGPAEARCRVPAATQLVQSRVAGASGWDRGPAGPGGAGSEVDRAPGASVGSGCRSLYPEGSVTRRTIRAAAPLSWKLTKLSQ